MPGVLMRSPGPDLAMGERTYVSPVPLDHRRARLEHRSLRARLERAGVGVRVLPPLPGHPDAAFVEDAAIVLPELTVLCRPGAPSRRGEVAAVAEALPGGRPLRRIRAPGTLEGGDVVLLGRTLLVGRSTRTNETGIARLADLLVPHGYAVRPVAVHGALHLRTACTQVGDGVLLCRPAWLDADGLAVAAGGSSASSSRWPRRSRGRRTRCTSRDGSGWRPARPARPATSGHGACGWRRWRSRSSGRPRRG